MDFEISGQMIGTAQVILDIRAKEARLTAELGRPFIIRAPDDDWGGSLVNTYLHELSWLIYDAIAATGRRPRFEDCDGYVSLVIEEVRCGAAA